MGQLDLLRRVTELEAEIARLKTENEALQALWALVDRCPYARAALTEPQPPQEEPR